MDPVVRAAPQAPWEHCLGSSYGHKALQVGICLGRLQLGCMPLLLFSGKLLLLIVVTEGVACNLKKLS